MTIKAALLDAPAASGKGRFLRMDELADESQLTERHVREVTGCDLPPGLYVWTGSTFESSAALERKHQPSFEKAFAALVAAVEKSGVEVPADTRAWLDYASARRIRSQKGK